MTAPIRRSSPPTPRCSAFVTANAGSGKTKTLVDRVARLLLRGAKPEAILCVTYTKAAAAEMQRRLFETLGDWAVMDDEALDQGTGQARGAAGRPRPAPGAPVRPRAGDARRAEDPDHPRLLREAAAALPAGGRRLAGLQGAGGPGRARRVGRGARPRRPRRGGGPRRTARRRLRPPRRRPRLPPLQPSCSPPSRPPARRSSAYLVGLRQRGRRRGRRLAPLRLRRRPRPPR